MIGQTFSRYTVIGDAEPKSGMRMVVCRCECGTEVTVYAKNLKSGNSRSCGCLKSEKTAQRNHKHGEAKSREWRIWVGLLQRCSQNAGKNAQWYSARGITVCDRWLTFDNFLADMGRAPEGAQIDRIDNALGYAPDNCRWATPSQNSRNRRNNTLLTHAGETMCIQAWADRRGWSNHLISNRLRYGWDISRALTEEPRQTARQ